MFRERILSITAATEPHRKDAFDCTSETFLGSGENFGPDSPRSLGGVLLAMITGRKFR